MSIDKQSSKIAFVCDVCGARFEADDSINRRPEVLWVAAKKLGWHARQQLGGKWRTACPQCATPVRPPVAATAKTSASTE